MYSIFSTAAKLISEGKDFAIATVIDTGDSTPQDIGAKMIVLEDGTIEGTVGGGPLEANIIFESKQCIKNKKSKIVEINLKPEEIGMMCGGNIKVFIEIVKKKNNILILGAGHIGEKLARLCDFLNIPYSIADDRKDFASKKRFPLSDNIYCDTFKNIFKQAKVYTNTYIVIVTRCHAFDIDCLKWAITTNAKYIGMIGSKNKVKEVFQKLNAEGIYPNKDKRVFAPIGLDFGTNDPAEIALSILSEIIKLETNKTGNHFREKIIDSYKF